MRTVQDVMEPQPITVPPGMTVRELARLLHERKADGACVVDEAGHLKGVVTAMDLIFQEKRVHMHTFFVFLDAVIPLDNPLRTRRELEKIAGGTAGDIMSKPLTVRPGTPLDEAASLMVERHLTVLPVVEDGRLVGLVTKPAMLRAAFDLT